MNLQEQCTGQTITRASGDRLLMRVTKKGHQFLLGKKVTPSVTAPCDTSLSDATGHRPHGLLVFNFIYKQRCHLTEYLGSA